jgi:hypothetical protein
MVWLTAVHRSGAALRRARHHFFFAAGACHVAEEIGALTTTAAATCCRGRSDRCCISRLGCVKAVAVAVRTRVRGIASKRGLDRARDFVGREQGPGSPLTGVRARRDRLRRIAEIAVVQRVRDATRGAAARSELHGSEELLDLAERQPVGHAVLPAVSLVIDDARAVLRDDFLTGHRSLIAVSDVHRPRIVRLTRVVEDVRVLVVFRGTRLVPVDDDRRAALLAANLDDLAEDLLVRDRVLGLARLALDLHRGSILRAARNVSCSNT